MQAQARGCHRHSCHSCHPRGARCVLSLEPPVRVLLAWPGPQHTHCNISLLRCTIIMHTLHVPVVPRTTVPSALAAAHTERLVFPEWRIHTWSWLNRARAAACTPSAKLPYARCVAAASGIPDPVELWSYAIAPPPCFRAVVLARTPCLVPVHTVSPSAHVTAACCFTTRTCVYKHSQFDDSCHCH